MELPSTMTITSASTSAGTAITMSVKRMSTLSTQPPR
jgi:hypothetical protein